MSLIIAKHTCYTKDFLTTSILKNKLQLGDEFEIVQKKRSEPAPAAKKSKGKSKSKKK